MKAQRASSERGVRPDSGRGLVGLLVAIVILAGMAAAVLGNQNGSGGDHEGRSSAGGAATTIDSSPVKAASDVSEGAQVACRTNYQAVTEAVAEYQVLHGRAPGDLAALAAMLRDPVTSAYYSITVDPTSPGAVEVATPEHPAAPGDTNCAYAGLG